MARLFLAHRLEGSEFVAMDCEPITACQAAAMLEVSNQTLLFLPVHQSLPDLDEPDSQHVSHSSDDLSHAPQV